MVPEPAESEILRAGPEDAGLLGWFRDGPGELVTALRWGPAECVVTGPASDLYLALWNRSPLTDPVLVSGDGSVLEAWQARVRVTWK